MISVQFSSTHSAELTRVIIASQNLYAPCCRPTTSPSLFILKVNAALPSIMRRTSHTASFLALAYKPLRVRNAALTQYLLAGLLGKSVFFFLRPVADSSQPNSFTLCKQRRISQPFSHGATTTTSTPDFYSVNSAQFCFSALLTIRFLILVFIGRVRVFTYTLGSHASRKLLLSLRGRPTGCNDLMGQLIIT